MSGLLARDPFSRERPQGAVPHAGARGGPELLFQPRFRLADRRLVAFEATTPRQRTRLFRGQALAQRDNREILRDRTVFHDACRYAASWTFQSAPDVAETVPLLSLRVSELQAASGLLAALLCEVLAESRLPAGRVELEFSEESLDGDEQELLYLLGSLRDLGVGVILGGFGASVSSLTLLRRRSIAGLLSGLRLSAAAAQELAESDQRDRDFLRGLGECAHALGLAMLAEGVETQAQFECLRDAGCDQAVGGWLGAQVPAVATLGPGRPLG